MLQYILPDPALSAVDPRWHTLLDQAQNRVIDLMLVVASIPMGRGILDANEAPSVGRVSPKHVEATPAEVGLEFHRSLTLDPALARDCVIQQMGRIDKIHPAFAF